MALNGHQELRRMLRGRSALQAVDVAEGARHDDVVVGAEDVVAGGEGDGVAVFDGEDVEPVLLADVGVHEVFARPLFGDFDLEHAVVGAELYLTAVLKARSFSG